MPMLLKDAIEEVKGLRFLVDRLDIRSAWAKRMLYTLPYLRTGEEIEAELKRVDRACTLLRDEAERMDKVCLKLMQVKDIRGTLQRVAEGAMLDDIELFEVKVFAIAASDIRELLRGMGEMEASGLVDLPDVEAVVKVLDPEGLRVPHFYVYDAYSEELTKLRKEMKHLQATRPEEEQQLEALRYRHLEMEDEIRASLSEQLHEHGQALREAFNGVAVLDILFAKGKQAIEMGLCRPTWTEGSTRYEQLFNPQVKDALEGQGKAFQAIDLRVEPRATLISGANMTGKSVVLKTVAVAQALFQFGFYVPAAMAEVAQVDRIWLCTGDEQNELQGLSSYAAEMLRVNAILQDVNGGTRPLVLIDELARTTNPTEGKAIVNAMLDFLTAHGVRALVTSHYNGIHADCRRLRVKGFIEEKATGPLTVDNINDCIDHSLVEDTGDSIPQGAMRIARMLGVDEAFLDKAENYLENEDIPSATPAVKAAGGGHHA